MTSKMVYGGPIYPVPVKPPSRFNRWGDWPKDLEPAIRALVRGWYRIGIFKCVDCEAFCHSHPYGAAHVRGKGHGRGAERRYELVPVCDDCLLVRARAVTADKRSQP